MSARRALVTGAGGFVCRHIVDALLARGWQVVALDHAFDDALRDAWAGRADMIAGDMTQPPDVRVDAVVHGAAITASPEEVGLSPEAYLRAHLDPALTLIEWAKAQGARRVLLLSSDAVFSETPPGLLDEDAPTQPRGLYAIAKAALENIALALRDDYGRDIAAMRLGSIYGPGEVVRPSRPRVSRVARMISEALTTRQIAIEADLPARSWTYVSDIGRAALALLESQQLRHALYNAASEDMLTLRDIGQAIQAKLPDVQLVEHPGEPSRDRRHHTLSSQRLRADTGFADWTLFAEGIAATIAWQRAQLEVMP